GADHRERDRGGGRDPCADDGGSDAQANGSEHRECVDRTPGDAGRSPEDFGGDEPRSAEAGGREGGRGGGGGAARGDAGSSGGRGVERFGGWVRVRGARGRGGGPSGGAVRGCGGSAEPGEGYFVPSDAGEG